MTKSLQKNKMADSPITNSKGDIRKVIVPTEETFIFHGKPSAFYNHHHQLTSAQGRLYATWSNGEAQEDEPGQRMMLSTSDDGGKSWTEARPLLTAPHGEHGPVILTSMGIRPYQDILVAYCGSYDYTATGLKRYYGVKGDQKVGRPKTVFDQTYFELGGIDPNQKGNQDTHCKILVSRDRGASWSQEGRIERLCPNLCPQKTAGGRLIMPGNMRYFYTDDPSGISGWKVAGLPRLPEDYVDDPAGFWDGKRHRGDEYPCCEGSFFQTDTDDGVIHMMLRTEDGWLAVSESRDQGVTYSEPMRTSYTDGNARFHFGRLPDGRWFGLSTPDPTRVHAHTPVTGRTPLVVAASRDGVSFNEQYVIGSAPAGQPRNPAFHKHGRYGYPSYHIFGNDMIAIYSINKEDIAFVSVPLGELD